MNILIFSFTQVYYSSRVVSGGLLSLLHLFRQSSSFARELHPGRCACSFRSISLQNCKAGFRWFLVAAPALVTVLSLLSLLICKDSLQLPHRCFVKTKTRLFLLSRGVNVLVDECAKGVNILYSNQKKCYLISLKECPLVYYTSEGKT